MVHFHRRTELQITQRIFNQLPERLRDKLDFRVKSDPYLLRTTVVFMDRKGNKYETSLEVVVDGYRHVACKIPDAFLARLCLVVN